MMIEKKPLALYVHIPFCVRKCAYCDFLSAPAAAEAQEEYIRALKREIALEAERAAGYEVRSVFFGGGTPSILKAGEIAGILEGIAASYQLSWAAEITVECNPGTLSADKLRSYATAGVNRLSIGLQSADNQELLLLGRVHTWEEFLHSYLQAQEAGFSNINIDLMSGLPGQTLASYESTLQRVAALQPAHISAYSLIIEEGTRFYELYGPAGERRAELPEEEAERQMYERTGQILERAGYHRYEISNYAKEGKECRHNICYWERAEYLGFGTGAASFFQGERFERERNLSAYISQIKENRKAVTGQHFVDSKEAMEEFMFLGLRMMKGISKNRFFREFGQDIHQVYGGAIGKYRELGLLLEEGDRIALTEAGISVSNVIFSDFIL